MITPGYIDLILLRWQPWRYVFEIPGYDLTGATFKMQFRDFADQSGSPRINLANAASSIEGLSVSTVTTSGVPTSFIQARIAEATIEGLPFPNPVGTDLELRWDLVIEAPGLEKARWVEGKAIIHGGSTQN